MRKIRCAEATRIMSQQAARMRFPLARFLLEHMRWTDSVSSDTFEDYKPLEEGK